MDSGGKSCRKWIMRRADRRLTVRGAAPLQPAAAIQRVVHPSRVLKEVTVLSGTSALTCLLSCCKRSLGLQPLPPCWWKHCAQLWQAVWETGRIPARWAVHAGKTHCRMAADIPYISHVANRGQGHRQGHAPMDGQLARCSYDGGGVWRLGGRSTRYDKL